MSLIVACSACTGTGPVVVAACPRCGGPVVHGAGAGFQDRHKPICPIFALGIAGAMSEAVRAQLHWRLP